MLAGVLFWNHAVSAPHSCPPLFVASPAASMLPSSGPKHTCLDRSTKPQYKRLKPKSSERQTVLCPAKWTRKCLKSSFVTWPEYRRAGLVSLSNCLDMTSIRRSSIVFQTRGTQWNATKPAKGETGAPPLDEISLERAINPDREMLARDAYQHVTPSRLNGANKTEAVSVGIHVFITSCKV